MDDYITRLDAMHNMEYIIHGLHIMYNDEDHINKKLQKNGKVLSKPGQSEIRARIRHIIDAHCETAYCNAVRKLQPSDFIQYYGKIYQLAKTLNLQISKTIKEKTKLKEINTDERLYYYHYVGNNSEYVQELTESGVHMKSLKASVNESGELPSAQRVRIRKMDPMMLEELFKLDGKFMNEDLRDFLNLKDDRSDYTFDYLKDTANGFTEYSSLKSAFHQTASCTKESDFLVPSGPQLLNAKFTHPDGREVVIAPNKEVVDMYPDKGTYNYVNSSDPDGHTESDVLKWFGLMFSKGIPWFPNFYFNDKKNSEYWPTDENE